MKINRHVGREFALKTLYTWEFRERNKPLLDVLTENNRHFYEYQDKKLEFTQLILEGIDKNLETIEQHIRDFAPEWPLEKIALIDRCILYIGIFEILFNKEVPEVVAINEAVELAKNYGSETSSKFVNGVLNTIFQKIKTSDKQD
ncbi:MAG: transcription antitermination factor NusB [Candidatus Gracilibacteria bacterium]